jgi:hypothetical protein
MIFWESSGFRHMANENRHSHSQHELRHTSEMAEKRPLQKNLVVIFHDAA